MAEDEDTIARSNAAAERKRITNRVRYARLVAQDPDYNKNRYRAWKEKNPDGNRDKYNRALERDSDFNKKKRQRQNDKRALGLLPPQKPRTANPGRKRRKRRWRSTEASRRRDKIKYEKNKASIIRRIVERQNQRYATDREYATLQGLRSRMSYALRSQSTKKSARSVELIGCTGADLVRHLESQFLEGMSWQNRNEWHIDHIIPVSAFNLTTEEGQQAAFHYTNLRPLWAHDNRVKSCKPPVSQKRFCFGYVTLADKRRAKARKGDQVTERRRA